MGYDFAEADMEKAFVSMQELDCGTIFVNIIQNLKNRQPTNSGIIACFLLPATEIEESPLPRTRIERRFSVAPFKIIRKLSAR